MDHISWCPATILIKHFSHVEAHERQEKGLLKPKLFQCEHCGKPMESKYRLKEHVALTHEKKSLDVKCTECALVFVHKRQMVHHRNLVHFPDRSEIVGKEFLQHLAKIKDCVSL